MRALILPLEGGGITQLRKRACPMVLRKRSRRVNDDQITIGTSVSHSKPVAALGRTPPGAERESRSGRDGRAAKRAFDLAERAVIVVLFIGLAGRLAPGLQPLNLGYLTCEGLVVIFVLCRRGTLDVDMSPYGVGVAILGALLPLLASPRGPALAPVSLCAAMIVFGFGVVVSAKLALNRRFGIAPANRGVQIGGPYRIVRHPMYLGYMLAQIGFVLSHASLWNCLILPGDWVIQVLRIAAEERVLKRDPDYRAYMAAVRWRLLPGFL